MQIDRFTHLQFPRHNMPSASENESSGVPPRTGSAKSQGPLPMPATDGKAARADSVVMKVQFPEGGATPEMQANMGIYTDIRRPSGVASDATVESDAQIAEHQRAIDRNAGVFTQITLNKDGVLVAKPQMVGLAKQPDFVALAVSAMREFSDEAERQKAHSFDPSEPASNSAWGGLKGLQHLAAKFNVFA